MASRNSVESLGQSEPSVGAALRDLRNRAGWTGHQLARRVGMSQAKISRIENGVGHVAPDDVETLARALGAPDAVVMRLVRQAERSQDRMTDWRSSSGVVADLQRDVEVLESATRVFRVFQPAVVPGLLQTSEYARAVLSANHAVRTGVVEEGGAGTVPEAVSARVHRQVALADPAKEFFFVITEAVLGNRFGRPDHMPAQIERLREVAQQDNVHLAVIPSDAPLRIPPMHGFVLFDDRVVTVDIFNTLLRTEGESDLRMYRHTFETLAEGATADVDEILDHYLDHYLAVSSRRRGRPPDPR